jgi:serine/threonine protein kinase
VIQCINTKCLHQNPDGSTHCDACGAHLLINNRLSVTKLLSEANPFSPPEVKTFEAIDLETREKIILRVLHSDIPSLTTPLLESVLCLRQIHQLTPHPGIMQLSEEEGYFTWQILSDEPESHFMATQKVEGIPLNDWLTQQGPANEKLAIDWLNQLVQSADALHQEGFVHQDIKPENIVLRELDAQLVLVDLGAIRCIDASQSLNSEIQRGVQSYPVIGTPGYQSAEQAEGRPNQASDYYSIGRTLMHLLTGVHPTELPTSASGQLIWRDLTQVSVPLADLIDRLAAPNQIHRPSTAKDILGYLDALLQSQALEKARSRYALRNKAARLVAFLLFLGLPLAVGTGSAWSAFQSRSEANRLFSEGNRMISTGTPNQAVPVLERAIKIMPESADLRATLALAYTLSGDTNAAINSYDQALAIDPQNPLIHYNLASVYESIDPQRAISNYQIAAQEGSPIQAEAVNNLARVYILEGNLAEAASLLQFSSEDSITQAALSKNKGWLQYEQGNLPQALAFLNESVELDPTRPDAYCLTSIIKQQQSLASRDDEITCLSLPVPEQRPEVQRWKMRLLQSQERFGTE